MLPRVNSQGDRSSPKSPLIDKSVHVQAAVRSGLPPCAPRSACAAQRLILRSEFNTQEIDTLELIQKYDKDGNGALDSSELQNLMKDVSGREVSENDISFFLLVADDNQDGLIDAGEIMLGMRAWYAFTHLPKNVGSVFLRHNAGGGMPLPSTKQIEEMLLDLNENHPLQPDDASFVREMAITLGSTESAASTSQMQKAVAMWYLNVDRGNTDELVLMQHVLRKSSKSCLEGIAGSDQSIDHASSGVVYQSVPQQLESGHTPAIATASTPHETNKQLLWLLASACCLLLVMFVVTMLVPVGDPTCEHSLHQVLVQLLLMVIARTWLEREWRIDHSWLTDNRSLRVRCHDAMRAISNCLAVGIIVDFGIGIFFSVLSSPARCGAGLYTLCLGIYVVLPLVACGCMCAAVGYKSYHEYHQVQRHEEELAQAADDQRKQIIELKKDIETCHDSRVASIQRTETGALDSQSSDARVQGWTELMQLNELDEQATGLDKDLLDAVWVKYDVDKSGSLDREELKLVVQDVAKARRVFLEQQLQRLKNNFTMKIEIESKLSQAKKLEQLVGEKAMVDQIFVGLRAGSGAERAEETGEIAKEVFMKYWEKAFVLDDASAEKVLQLLPASVFQARVLDVFDEVAADSADSEKRLQLKDFQKFAQRLLIQPIGDALVEKVRSKLYILSIPLHFLPKSTGPAVEEAIITRMEHAFESFDINHCNKFIELLFGIFDADHNGTVEKREVVEFFEELKGETYKVNNPVEGKDLICRLGFRLCDKNGDQKISLDEARHLSEALVQLGCCLGCWAVDIIDLLISSAEVESALAAIVSTHGPFTNDTKVSRAEYQVALQRANITDLITKTLDMQNGRILKAWEIVKMIRSKLSAAEARFTNQLLLQAMSWKDGGINEENFLETAVPLMKTQVLEEIELSTIMTDGGLLDVGTAWSEPDLTELVKDLQTKAAEVVPEICRQIFRLLDLDNSGIISRHETTVWKATMDGFLRLGTVSLVDSGGDLAAVDRDQLRAVYPDLFDKDKPWPTIQDETRALLMAIFDIVDRDGDGNLELHELTGFILKLASVILQVMKAQAKIASEGVIVLNNHFLRDVWKSREEVVASARGTYDTADITQEEFCALIEEYSKPGISAADLKSGFMSLFRRDALHKFNTTDFQFRPSVGTWLMPLPKPMGVQAHEADS